MRTVTTEEAVDSFIDRVVAQHPRIGQQLDAIKWRIAHRPEDGVRVEDAYVYRQRGVGPGNPDITILYIFTEQEVNILDIRLAP